MRGNLLAILLLLSSSLFTACKANNSAQASGPPPVQVQTLQNSTLQDSVEYNGTLQAEQTVNLKPQSDGQITAILVKPGDRVQPGQPLFRLTPNQTSPQFSSAQATVNAAIAARGTAVQQLQVARSQLASAQSQYDLAGVTANRSKFLLSQGAVPQATVDQDVTALKVQANNVKTARDQVEAAIAGVKQAEANIRKAQADAEAARIGVDLKQVSAPIAGSVGNITLKVGDYVTTGQTLTTVNQNGNFDLQIPIPLSRSGQLRTGLAVQLLDPTTRQELGNGSIYFVSPQSTNSAQSTVTQGSSSTQVNAPDQTIVTRARFPNPNGKLRDGQYVIARVIWQTKPGVLVPVEAVSPIGGQNFVFVAVNKTDDKGKTQTIAHQVPVTLGNIQGQAYQILKGLNQGDQVIVSGISKLKEGSPVAPQENNQGNNSGNNLGNNQGRAPQSGQPQS